MTSEVDKWLQKRDPASAQPMQRAREIILRADERVTEAIKWSTPTFIYKGNILSFTPAKAGVGLMFHRGADIPGKHPRLEGEGKLVRTMHFSTVEDVEAGRKHIERAIAAWCRWRDSETTR